MSADWILRNSLLHPDEYQAKYVVGMVGSPRIPRMTLRDLTLEIFELPRQSGARVISLKGSPDQMWAFYTWVMYALPNDLYEEVNDLGGIDYEVDIRDRITGAPICVMIVSPAVRCETVVEMRHIIGKVKMELNNQDPARLICIFAGNDPFTRACASMCITLPDQMVVYKKSERRSCLLEW